MEGRQQYLTRNGKVKAVSDLSATEWQSAIKRYNIIAPIINNEANSSIEGVAKQSGIGRTTIFRWLQRYNQTGSVSSLVRNKSMGGKGKSRLLEEVETIINVVIEERYLTRQKLTVKKAAVEVAGRCRSAGLPVPHYLTVRNRINKVSEEKRLARRTHSSIARDRYKPVEGSFPGADYPLAAVQIDHTPLDIIVVDDIYRKPVGKPWITMAIDVFSRMVIGFYISLDPPGALGTGLCMSHAILPKDIWMTEMDIKGKWPCYGVMSAIHIDNAKEFHGKMLERACQEYGIEINFRPVATPNYGGHIERLLGTVLGEIHTLPGTTFSSTKDRKYYRSEEKACFTLKELEKWLATFIANVYHQRFHSAINTTPIAKYNEGILGSDEQIGTGLQRPIEDELKLKLDFMPVVERTVQRYGVSIEGIWYYHDILRKWVFAYERPNARNKVLRKFAFKIDPRDISAIYFYDPEIGDYFCIPYRNTSHPAITIWEHRRILRDLKDKGMKHVNEDIIFEAYDQMRNMETIASGNTAVAKRLRNRTRKRYATGGSIKNEFNEENECEMNLPCTVDFTKHYLPFEDIEG